MFCDEMAGAPQPETVGNFGFFFCMILVAILGPWEFSSGSGFILLQISYWERFY